MQREHLNQRSRFGIKVQRTRQFAVNRDDELPADLAEAGQGPPTHNNENLGRTTRPPRIRGVWVADPAIGENVAILDVRCSRIKIGDLEQRLQY